MLAWIGLSIFIAGFALWRRMQHLGDTSFSGDAGMALVIPVIASWIAMGLGAILALIWLIVWLFHHVNFQF